MKKILMTSSYPESVIEDLRKRWEVVYIPNQKEALAYLGGRKDLPLVASIGLVGPSSPGSDLDARAMLRAIHRLDPHLPVIVSTHQQSRPVIIDFIKRGAFDYVVEPKELGDSGQYKEYIQDLVFSVTRAVEWSEVVRENRRLKDDRVRQHQPGTIRGRSPGILKVVELIGKVAPTPATVLVTGESGTGKELVARAIHASSAGRDQPFTAVNCGAIQETLLASELFGHVKGAFTGAQSDRAGMIRETGSGTLFLDEISAVSEGFQVMLLRVLEARRARPVGGSGEYGVDCRFISAANRNLEELVGQGRFREDLYYRLNVFHIHLPSLRERREDIPVLADYFLHQASEAFGKPVRGISPAVMDLLEEYSWPGNVRQLRNALERAVILCEKEVLGLEDLDPKIRHLSGAVGAVGDPIRYQEAMDDFERRLIQSALTRARGNRSLAARQLSIKRTTLNYRIKSLNIVI